MLRPVPHPFHGLRQVFTVLTPDRATEGKDGRTPSVPLVGGPEESKKRTSRDILVEDPGKVTGVKHQMTERTTKDDTLLE